MDKVFDLKMLIAFPLRSNEQLIMVHFPLCGSMSRLILGLVQWNNLDLR